MIGSVLNFSILMSVAFSQIRHVRGKHCPRLLLFNFCYTRSYDYYCVTVYSDYGTTLLYSVAFCCISTDVIHTLAQPYKQTATVNHKILGEIQGGKSYLCTNPTPPTMTRTRHNGGKLMLDHDGV